MALLLRYLATISMILILVNFTRAFQSSIEFFSLKGQFVNKIIKWEICPAYRSISFYGKDMSDSYRDASRSSLLVPLPLTRVGELT